MTLLHDLVSIYTIHVLDLAFRIYIVNVPRQCLQSLRYAIAFHRRRSINTTSFSSRSRREAPVSFCAEGHY